VDFHRPTPPLPPKETHPEDRARLPAFLPEPLRLLDTAKGYFKEARAFVEDIHHSGASGLSVCRLNTAAVDQLMVGVFETMTRQFSIPGDLALLAVGGYGRKELSPHSDVDLLLIRGSQVQENAVQPFAKAFHTLLWDLKLVVGWGVRTVAETLHAAEEDHTVRTALLDVRHIAGSNALFDSLATQHLPTLLSHRAEVFIADKSREIRERRMKYGESVFLLEPEVKKGEGGLRDLEGALWIARARFGARHLSDLLDQSLIPRSEIAALRAARDFLLRIRNHLHFVRGRKEDRLTFDLQQEVARFFGYVQTDEGLPVEQFMRHYYLSAKTLVRAADQLIARCEESREPSRVYRVEDFRVQHGRLAIDSPEGFEQDPSAMIRIFHVSDAHGLPLHSATKDRLTESLETLRRAYSEPAVVHALKALLTRPDSRGAYLNEMHELGVLGAVLPEFGRVTALHQHDLYHVYTVDVHSLFALKRLYFLRAGDLQRDEPQLSREMSQLADPLPLYLGMLFHDAGKGMGGNHSERGRALMAQVCDRLGLSDRQADVAQFLVLKHLLMSHTAQRRDLSDPNLIAQFAQECGDLEKLTALYLLTYADICSVGPSMWTQWKAQLLWELYEKTRAHLSRGSSHPVASSQGEPSRAAFVERWQSCVGEDRAEVLARVLPERYFRTVDVSDAALHARLLERARHPQGGAFVRRRAGTQCSRLWLATSDRPGLLALLAGVLSAHRIDILGAQVFSTTDGRALDVFDVQAPHEQPLDRARWRAARADLCRVLRGEMAVDEVLRRRRPSSLLKRPLPEVATKVTIDNFASQHFTVVDVRTQDRVGVLYAIASAFYSLDVEIVLAKVATEAHRAVDAFYVLKGDRKIEDPQQMGALGERVQQELEALAERFGQ
jgi:[protein-PII] uridylyltransferase